MRTLATKGPWNQFKESTFLDTQQLDHTFLSNWSPWMGPDILKPMDTTTLNVKTELWFHDPPVAKNIWRCLAFPYLYLPNAGLSCSQPTSLKYKRICKIQKIQIFIIHMLKTICNIYIYVYKQYIQYYKTDILQSSLDFHQWKKSRDAHPYCWPVNSYCCCPKVKKLTMYQEISLIDSKNNWNCTYLVAHPT